MTPNDNDQPKSSVRRWWLNDAPHSPPRMRGETYRFTAWSKKPTSGLLVVRYIEVMPVEDHDATVKDYEARLAELDKEIETLQHALKQEIQNNDEFGCEFVYIVMAKETIAQQSQELARARLQRDFLFERMRDDTMATGCPQAGDCLEEYREKWPEEFTIEQEKESDEVKNER